jgi:hypothetical protein
MSQRRCSQNSMSESGRRRDVPALLQSLQRVSDRIEEADRRRQEHAGMARREHQFKGRQFASEVILWAGTCGSRSPTATSN